MRKAQNRRVFHLSFTDKTLPAVEFFPSLCYYFCTVKACSFGGFKWSSYGALEILEKFGSFARRKIQENRGAPGFK